ncbi:MAG: YraN family protein [Spirochaetaceae bacterium]|nr:MAG: YraN family protein [Spirochaetaceae bacterium]
MENRPSSSEKGREGEEIALDFLLKKEYTIYKRNHVTPRGEIDIIAGDRGTIVFVEVKMSNLYEVSDIGRSVGNLKRRKLRDAGLLYLRDKYGTVEIPCRFDVILINLLKDRIMHFENAF